MLQPKISQVEPLEGYRLMLCYETGEVKLFDVLPYISGGWFEEFRDRDCFQSVHFVSGGVGIERAPVRILRLKSFMNWA